ncbi:alpha/beta hydrolase [Weissella muntiaci]|uniref:Alpha/beta hydrolase n=1 Tax=Weissella muntiaci TaxID=2508881 RepID=A0A6C2C5T6_9LACO|nr:alpha/beta hydrolase [Weissella muntiaci]TYC48916.1 alpha/beta hydrolase [Weissella muntiaci]
MARNKHRWSTKKKAWIFVGSMIALVFMIGVGAGGYFFKVAEVREKKSFITGSELSKKDVLYQEQQAFINQPTMTEWQQTATDGTKLVGYYVPAAKATKKTVIVIHGFGVDHKAMAPYGTMFHNMGYNVLMPDDRAAGKSGGKYIGYGYLDAKDYLKWIDQVVAKNGQDSEIVVMGASMGGATTMMLSGMNPPTQVKAFIEDAGYSSVSAELKYQAGSMYGLPKWLSNILIPVVSAYSKVFAGYSYGEADAVKLLKNNQRPMLFIHGGADTFVPTRFVNQVYRATKGPKEKMIVPNAKHVQSYATDPIAYENKVRDFMTKYFK